MVQDAISNSLFLGDFPHYFLDTCIENMEEVLCLSNLLREIYVKFTSRKLQYQIGQLPQEIRRKKQCDRDVLETALSMCGSLIFSSVDC